MPKTASYSEVSSYLGCRRKWYYNYGLNLERIDTSESLADGKAGHAALETYYNFRKVGTPHNESIQLALGALHGSGYKWNADGNRADIERMLRMYFEQEPFVNQGYTVIDVEHEYILEWDGGALKFVVDLVLRDPHGAIVVVDHKFSWAFVTDEATEIQPQIPLYMGALRALGMHADYGIYNQIRTQKIVGKKSAKFPDGEGPTHDQAHRIHYLRPTIERIQRTFVEQAGVGRELAARRLLPLDVIEATSWRIAQGMTCNNCQFRNLCISDLRGSNSELILRTEYQQRKPRNNDIEQD